MEVKDLYWSLKYYKAKKIEIDSVSGVLIENNCTEVDTLDQIIDDGNPSNLRYINAIKKFETENCESFKNNECRSISSLHQTIVKK